MLREEMCKIHHGGLQFSAWDSSEPPLPLGSKSRSSPRSGGAAELCLQAVLWGEKAAVALKKYDTDQGNAMICYQY